MGIHSLIPDAQTLLALEPEELAGVVLQYLRPTLPSGPGSDGYDIPVDTPRPYAAGQNCLG